MKLLIFLTFFLGVTTSSLFAGSFVFDEWSQYEDEVSYEKNPGKYFLGFRYSDYDYGEYYKKVKKVKSLSKEEFQKLREKGVPSKPFSVYPNLKFYSTPSLGGEVVLEVNEGGLFYKGQKVCARKYFLQVLSYFCPDPLLKFKNVEGAGSIALTLYFEFDKILRDDIIKAKYKGEDVYLDLKSIENFDRVPFDYGDNKPESHKKEEGALGYYWIKKPTNLLYKNFMSKYPFVKKFIKRLKSCLEKEEPKCLKEMSDETLKTHLFASVFYGKTNKSEEWKFDNLSNIYSSIRGCFDEGEVVSFHENKKNPNRRIVNFSLLNERSLYDSDGEDYYDIYCKFHLDLKQKDGEWVSEREVKLRFGHPNRIVE